MAGRPGRSGGARSGLIPLNPSTPAPELNSTLARNAELIAWAARELALGNMDPRHHDSFVMAARADQGQIRLAHTVREMEELRDLVARQEAAIQSLTRREQEDRYSSAPTASVTLGRVRAPDGDAH